MKAKKRTNKPTQRNSKKSAPKKMGQKSATRREKRNVSSSATPASPSLFISASPDKAHSPGHRKLDFQSQVEPHDFFPQKNSNQNKLFPRRIITGAAVGKTGRIILK